MLRVEGSFAEPVTLRIRVGTVSCSSRLVVKADGTVIWDKVFQCGPGEGEWKKAVYQPQWQNYQNVYDRDYTATIPAGARVIELDNVEGDWLTLTELGFKPACQEKAREHVLGLAHEWGEKQEPVRIVPNGEVWLFRTPELYDRSWLWDECIEPWQELESKGVGVVVGEWGAYSRTPHDVVLTWMEDCLRNWEKAGWGWALWNFRGSFGILDSARGDVAYEDWRGHKLDRKMLNLLQRY
jgi:hypothetical protein